MDYSFKENLKINKTSWDAAAQRFFGRTALTDYGSPVTFNIKAKKNA